LLAGNSNLIEFEPQVIAYGSVLSDLIIVKDAITSRDQENCVGSLFRS